MNQVLNELSLSASLSNIDDAKRAIIHLQEASHELYKLGFSNHVHITTDFAYREITPGYNIKRLLSLFSHGKENTIKTWLISLLTSLPYTENVCQKIGITHDEYSINNTPCKGLALAAFYGAPALSLDGDNRFIPPHIVLTHSFISDSSGEIKNECCQVGIISQKQDISHHIDIIHSLPLNNPRTGADLLQHIKERFNALIFSTTAEDQLIRLQQGSIILARLSLILQELNRALNESLKNNTPFIPIGFNYTASESNSATQGKKGEKHKFTFNINGITHQRVLCESHMRITDRLRIYFKYNPDIKKVLIGHIGDHLPGKKYG